MINIHLTIAGRVQGVGFRWGTLRLAQELGLNGFVKNLSDGTVYVEVQGPKQIVAKFIDRLSQGPTPYAIVEHVSQASCPLSDYQNRFTIR